VQPGEREFHLRLHASGSHHAAVGGVRQDMVEEGRLADTRFAAEHDHAARTGSSISDEAIERPALGAPIL